MTAADVKATSALAAAAQGPAKIRPTRAVILTLLRQHGPLIDEQLVHHYVHLQRQAKDVQLVTPQSIRTRRHELHVSGHIREAGRGQTSLGYAATLWALSDDQK